MTRQPLPMIALLVLAACRPPGEPDAPAATATATAAAPTPTPSETGDRIVSAERLAGEYRVAGIDGAGIDLPHAITVSIDAETIRYTSQCVTGAWRYRFEGRGIVLDPVVEAVCDRGRYPEEDAIDTALAAATLVRRTAASAVVFQGGGHRVTLFSQ